MQKSNLFIFVLTLILIAQNVSASALSGPVCFVTAEVIEMGSETRQYDSGSEYENHYLHLKILSVDKGNNLGITSQCPVQKNQVYIASDNYYARDDYPASFKVGDRIKAGVEDAGSLGENGVVTFLHWSDITYENGSTILARKGIVIYLSSDDEPLNIEKVDDSEHEVPNFEDNKDKNGNIVNYLYLIIPLLIIVGFLLYKFLYKRSAP